MSKPPEQSEQENKKYRYFLTGATYRSVVEQQILDAQEEGKFDNLPGHGKPLQIDRNLHAGDQELAYKLLKDNDFTLPWIADRNRIYEQIEQMREKFGRQWRLHGPQLQAMQRAGQEASANNRWQALLSQWQTEIDTLNRRIAEVNLSLPIKQLEIIKLSLDAEKIRVGAEL